MVCKLLMIGRLLMVGKLLMVDFEAENKKSCEKDA